MKSLFKKHEILAKTLWAGGLKESYKSWLLSKYTLKNKELDRVLNDYKISPFCPGFFFAVTAQKESSSVHILFLPLLYKTKAV